MSISVMSFGAVADVVTPDTIHFQNAINSLGSPVGQLHTQKARIFYLDQDLYVRSNCTLEGPMGKVGSPGSNSTAPYTSLTAMLLKYPLESYFSLELGRLER